MQGNRNSDADMYRRAKWGFQMKGGKWYVRYKSVE